MNRRLALDRVAFWLGYPVTLGLAAVALWPWGLLIAWLTYPVVGLGVAFVIEELWRPLSGPPLWDEDGGRGGD